SHAWHLGFTRRGVSGRGDARLGDLGGGVFNGNHWLAISYISLPLAYPPWLPTNCSAAKSITWAGWWGTSSASLPATISLNWSRKCAAARGDSAKGSRGRATNSTGC